MKTIYLISASNTLKNAYNILDNTEYEPKYEILSCSGEQLASSLSYKSIFKDLDKIYSSSYISALQTTKYIARNNNMKINVTSSLDEHTRGHLGSLTLKEAMEQELNDFDFKLRYGESLNETKQRLTNFLKKVLAEKDEKVALVSHNNAIFCLLLNWCELGYNYEQEPILSFNNEIIHDGVINNPEVFELKFDDNKNIISIKTIESTKDN